jgi:predicted secreted protein
MSIRQLLISTIAFAVIPTAVLSAADTAEYTGGTVKSIPMNSIGFLNLEDTKVMKFTYGQAVYKLPYDQITGTEVTKGDTKHVLKKFPVPSLCGKKDLAGVTGKLSFEVTARLAASVQDTIQEQKALPLAEATIDPNEWWGDKYWKTTRNKATWDANNASAAATAQPAAPAAAPAATPAVTPANQPTGNTKN